LSASICSAQGVIITLKNPGPSTISNAFLGFDKQPLDPGQTLDVTVGDGFSPSNIGDFQIGVIPISENNPLPPGGTACVGPLYDIASGDYVEFVQVDSFGGGITSSPPIGVFKLIPDVTTFPFDVPNDVVQGGRIAGVFRFFSSVPDSCKKGYAPPFGKMGINSDALLTTSTSVDLSLSCYPTVGYSCQEMQFSDDNINWSAPEPYKRDKAWTLSQGDGRRTVYVKFKDNVGNWSNACNDTIILSTPTLTQTRSFPIPAFPDPGINVTELTFGNGKLFARNSFYDPSTQSSKAKIYVLNPANGNILNSFSSPSYGNGIASDGVNLYENMFEPVGDIVKLDSTDGSILATIHPSGVSITGGTGGLALLNGDFFQVATTTENCDGVSIVRLNKEDGSFLGCFNVESLGIFPDKLASDGTNLLCGRWVKDVLSDRYYWAVFTLSPNGTFLKSDITFSVQGNDAHGSVSEAWGDNQLFVVDRQNNQIIVFRFPSSGIVVPTSLNFGKVLIGSASAPQTVTISNPGSANLVISSVGITGTDAGMFNVETGGPKPCSSLTPTIAPGENCTVVVTFSPTSTHGKTAVLSISFGGPDEPPLNVSLSGTGFNTVTVVTPGGDEVIPSGSTYAIHWGAPSDAVKFDLKYSINNGSTWKTIARNVTGTSYDWDVPIPSDNKTSCLVKVIGFDSSGKEVGEDISDSPFTIEVVKLTYPAEGQILESGNTRAITWRTNGTAKPVASVKLSYSINGGVSWKAIKTLKSNTGSYDWTVPTISNLSTGCKIKVVLKSAGGTTVGNTVSSGVFTIQ
jgi:hypothetical protein